MWHMKICGPLNGCSGSHCSFLVFHLGVWNFTLIIFYLFPVSLLYIFHTFTSWALSILCLPLENPCFKVVFQNRHHMSYHFTCFIVILVYIISFNWKLQVIGTWDDHDYGLNDAGKEFSGKDATQRLLLDFLDEPEDSARWVLQMGLWSYFTWICYKCSMGTR